MNGGVNFDPLPDESSEHRLHRISETLFANDWGPAFSANLMLLDAVTTALAEEHDPEKIIGLALIRHDLLIKSLGSGFLVAKQQQFDAERINFDTLFGQAT